MEKKAVRTLQGIVMAKNTQNTIKVEIESRKPHPLYQKVTKSHKRYLVHCENTDELAVGDEVIIAEAKPISKLKKWTFVKKVLAK